MDKIINGKKCIYIGPLSQEESLQLFQEGKEILASSIKIDNTRHYWVEEQFALPFIKDIRIDNA